MCDADARYIIDDNCYDGFLFFRGDIIRFVIHGSGLSICDSQIFEFIVELKLIKWLIAFDLMIIFLN